jgi:hypothetical protein
LLLNRSGIEIPVLLFLFNSFEEEDSLMKFQRSGFQFSQIICSAFILFSIAFTINAQIELQKPKSAQLLPNPYMMAAPRDEILTATKQMFEGREIPLDKEDCNQLTGECTLISKPVIFIKGTMTRSQLEHYCDVPAANVRNWAKGRYVLRIQIAPTSPRNSQVSVHCKFEGMSDNFTGNEWVQLTSKGTLEDELMRCMEDRVRGGNCENIKPR